QLAPLASQHHMSEYSRIKYGHEGSPVTYMPLSLHVPDVVRELRECQEKYADQVLWWPCTSSLVLGDTSSVIPVTEQRAALCTGENTTPHPELQQDLFDALSQLIPNQSRPQSQPQPPEQQDVDNRFLQVKTSDTHPINISLIIPPESLAAISSHLTPCSKPYPVLFDIPFPYNLDRITGYAQSFPSLASLPIIPLRSTSVSPALPPLHGKRHISHEPRRSVSEALHAALNARISLPPMPIPSPRVLKCSSETCSIPRGEDDSEREIANMIPKLFAPRKSMFVPTRTLSQPPQCPFPSLGNLLLSSCPGKKIRLSGPVRGRSTVCRDLVVDLRRMKNLGARCVICCLDDEELQFLGISWVEYCQAAHQEGLDVLRIPLPEGLAPLSPKSLDADVGRIIERYTSQGISVLAHCRGGVGRAGLFACCWMLRLGLCGWIETDVSAAPASTGTDTEVKEKRFQWDSNTVVPRDTLQLVERAIGVVRRRRSVKAIETLEQVQFLVEYVEYLRACRRAGEVSASSRNSITS
ncbi:phosphatases II, partial [Melanogaster broomeanus]